MKTLKIAHLQRRGALWGALVATMTLGVGPGTASAVGFDLDVEFDTGQTGSFAHVEIQEDFGALDFSIEVADALGDEADLHEFYFNLLGDFTGLAISTDDGPKIPYSLLFDPSINGGAGASFDYGVNFGNGAGKSGNGVLDFATFTLTADQLLSIDDLLETSSAAGGTIEVQFAAHIQGTEIYVGNDSETVGGNTPEPATGALVALGLAVLGSTRPRRS
jgi:MYXO-CTERM domain-containing protein